MTTVDARSSVKISKVDLGGAEVVGATLRLTGKDTDGNIVNFGLNSVQVGEGGIVLSGSGTQLAWISGEGTTFVLVEDGTYVLHEDAAPEGYAVANDIEFTVANGKITVNSINGNEDVEFVEMIDERIVTTTTTETTTTTTAETTTTTTTTSDLETTTSTTTTTTTTTTETTTETTTTTVVVDVTISKQDIFGGEVEGAKLTLTGKDSEGNEVTFNTNDVVLGRGAELESTGSTNELTWISGSESTIVKNLGNGTYTLHEVAAPDGYEVTTDITFTIEDGKVTGENVTSSTVTMTDDYKRTDVQISKANVFSQEIAGAELTLTGKDFTGKTVEFQLSDVTLGTGAELISTANGTTLQWISGTSSTIVKNLTDGDYVLHEVAAPDGYQVTTDISFTIVNGEVIGTTDNKITMTDTMTGEAEISKSNVFGDEITGAELRLTGKDKNGNDITFDLTNVALGREAELKSTENGTEIIWISGSTSTVVRNLVDGTYTLHEVAAPNGYEVTTDITFTVEDGKLTGGAEVTSNTVTMTDDFKKTDVNISKANVLSEELAGAELTLTGKDLTGRTVTFTGEQVTLGTGAELTGVGEKLTFISGSTATMVRGLADGTYVLHEVAAPEGYEVTTDIEFTIENGVVTGTSVSGNTVTMIDEMSVVLIDTDVEISKKNLLGDELKGATLTLTGKDAEGNDIVFDITNITLGREAELVSTENGTELTWISGSTATFVNGLTDGTYVLHETAAPSGYEVTTDIIFTIEDGQLAGEVGVESSSVTMIDDMVLSDVEISKKNTIGDEVKGATLTLTGTDLTGREVIFDISKVALGKEAELVTETNGTELTWISGSTATMVRGLADGTYVLHEVAAPNGYEVTTDITFTIENGTVSGVTGVESNSVTITDEMILTDVEISKKNTIGEELKGATLTLTGTDFTGREVIFDISKVALGKEAELVTETNGTKLTWISGSTATMVRGLTDGTYVLHEVAAPNGYEVTTDITFTIENGKVSGVTGVESNSVTMIDEMIVTTTASTTGTATTTTTTTTATATTAVATTQTAGATTAAATTVTAAKATTATATSAPKTGDNGIALTMLLMALAAGSAFAFRKKEED